MSPYALTIAIPTYNRNELLLRSVRYLLQEPTDNVKLLVLDNHSEVPVSETLLPVMESLQTGRLEIHRNVVNVGSAANMLRCFELCQTKWIWLITEKTVLKPGGITKVLQTLEDHPDCVFINFDVALEPPLRHIPHRSESITTTGRAELIRNILYFGTIIDQMANVYSVPRCRPFLDKGYFYAASGAAQLVLVLLALRDTDHCFLSCDQIVTRIGKPPQELSSWSTLAFAQNCMTVLNLPLTRSERKILQQKLIEFMPSLRHYIAKFIVLAADRDPSAYYYFSHYVHLMTFHDRRLYTRLALTVARFMMMAPSMTARCLDRLAQWGFNRSIYEAGETREQIARASR